MLTKPRVWRRVLSHWFGYWCGKHNRPYCCSLWANNDAYTVAYLGQTDHHIADGPCFRRSLSGNGCVQATWGVGKRQAVLDPSWNPTTAEFRKRLILLARPRGFEPLLPP
jgi:hypothetical protein